jgi:primosomal protein N' (replication factor Y)
MYFYEVWVRSGKFHGLEPLTYSYESSLELGSVVTVPLRQETALAIVTRKVPKPSFKTKPLAGVVEGVVLPKQSLLLMEWLLGYYPSSIGMISQLFLPPGLLRSQEIKAPPMAAGNKKPLALPPLTAEQAETIRNIRKQEGLTALIDGVTGSGKTRVYMELARQTLDEGRSVIVLTPEISLTPQLTESFRRHFNQPVISINSHLTEAERRDVWLQAANANQPLIIIGPRSALFSPLNNIGLIIIDEAHESAYKQEQSPYYYTPRVAGKLAQLHKAVFVLGSATLPISEYYLALQKNIPIYSMPSSAIANAAKSTVEVISLRDRQQFSRQHYLSDSLLNKIREALARKEQSMVFLNRRGTARLVLCQVCGWQVLCPLCDIPMTYHADNHALRCHTCGQTRTPPSSCESCGSVDILFKSIGTKALVEALQKEFPRARIQRFDTDNLKAERFEKHFDSVFSGSVDILVGTQQLAKGLDLPKLSVLGVVIADSSLYFPDYTAEENTYQLLTQVMGRVGRGHTKQAETIIQTYHPGSLSIQAAVTKDWQPFYESQLKEREAYLFPPFCYVLKLRFDRASSAAAKTAAEKALGELKLAGLKIRFIGPSPSFREKTGGKYSWQIIAKSKDRQELIKLIPLLPSGTFYDIDPASLL